MPVRHGHKQVMHPPPVRLPSNQTGGLEASPEQPLQPTAVTATEATQAAPAAASTPPHHHEAAKVQRIGRLRHFVDEISGNQTELSAETREYLRGGGSLQEALAEINSLRNNVFKEPTKTETELTDARSDFVETLKRRAPQRRSQVHKAHSRYGSALAHLVVEATAGASAAASTVEEFADAQIGVIADLVVAERQKLRAMLSQSSKESFAARVLKTPALRRSVVGSVVSSALAVRLGLVPGASESLDHTLQTNLEMFSAFLFARGTQRHAYKRLTEAAAERRLRGTTRKIEQDETVADDLIDRTTRKVGVNHAKTKDPKTTADARRFAGDFYDRHLTEVKALAKQTEGAEEKFAELVSKVIDEELAKMRHEMASHPGRRVIFEGLALVLTFSGGNLTYKVAESFTVGAETSEAINFDEEPL